MVEIEGVMEVGGGKEEWRGETGRESGGERQGGRVEWRGREGEWRAEAGRGSDAGGEGGMGSSGGRGSSGCVKGWREGEQELTHLSSSSPMSVHVC